MFRGVPGRGEDPLDPTLAILEHRRVERDIPLDPGVGLQDQFVVRDRPLRQRRFDPSDRPIRVHEVIREWAPDELLPRIACDGLHLVIEVRDDPVRVDRDERIHRRLDETPVVAPGIRGARIRAPSGARRRERRRTGPATSHPDPDTSRR